MADNLDGDSNEQKVEHERKEEKRAENVRNVVIRFERFAIAGNAGGTIAVLSFIGTSIGSGAETIPASSFWVLVIFVFGLIVAAIVRFLDVLGAVKVLAESPGLDTAVGLGLVVPLICALVGITSGLVIIYGLTG